jgi:hypothetical protein
MATCDISAGRGLSCKNAIAGLLNVYFINYGEGLFTYDTATEEITGTTGTVPNAYKYELHLGNDVTQNIQSSPENGTLYFEQVLNLTLKKLSKEDNVQIKTLASGRPHIMVEDQMGNFMLIGRVNGADVVSGTAVTGNAFGDLNGYTLAFTGNEPTLANFYVEPATPGDPSPFLTDFTIVSAV